MTKEDYLEASILQQIQDVVDGKSEGYSSNISIGIDKISSYLCEQGFEKGEFDTNSWQYDYWLTFTHKELGKFALSGSGYYGKQVFVKEEN